MTIEQRRWFRRSSPRDALRRHKHRVAAISPEQEPRDRLHACCWKLKPLLPDSSPPSPKQFDDPFLGIARGRRWRRVALKGCARFRRKLSVSRANRYCFPLCDEEQPVPAQSCSRNSEFAQCGSEGARERCACLGDGSQSDYYSASPSVGGRKYRVKSAVSLAPLVQDGNLMIG